MTFRDRKDAGEKLGMALQKYAGADAVVYAIPRGGVVLGYEVAKALHVPLDLVITRKVGHPNNPEYALCAVSEDGTLLCDEDERADVDEEWLRAEVEKQQQEAVRRRKSYLKDREHISAKGKTAIIIDDGVATGLTMRAAVLAVKKEQPQKIIVAVPVGPQATLDVLGTEANEVIAIKSETHFLGSVGSYYSEFHPVEDDEVIMLIAKIPVN